MRSLRRGSLKRSLRRSLTGSILWTALVCISPLALLPAPAFAAETPTQAFHLEPGDFRWIPFNIKQVPTAIDCRYDVLEGGATVHAELLPIEEFRRFDRGLEHDTLAITDDARLGGFRRVVDTPGRYAIVLVNNRKGKPVTASLHLATTLNPGAAAVATTLSPARRLTVILISFAFFLISVSWSSRTLIRAMRRSGESHAHGNSEPGDA